MPTADEVLREVMDEHHSQFDSQIGLSHSIATRCAAAETRLAEVERERTEEAVDYAFALAEAKRERDALRTTVSQLRNEVAQREDARFKRMDNEDAITGGRSLGEVCDSERALRAEVEYLKTCSTNEVMCENYNVDAHVREWEARCLKAEAEVEALRADRERLDYMDRQLKHGRDFWDWEVFDDHPTVRSALDAARAAEGRK